MRQGTRDLLNRARELIDNYGWIQGHLTRVDDDGCICGYCIMGALQEASKEADSLDHYCQAYHYIMYKLGFGSRLEITQYNDDPHRTKEQVRAVFD